MWCKRSIRSFTWIFLLEKIVDLQLAVVCFGIVAIHQNQNVHHQNHLRDQILVLISDQVLERLTYRKYDSLDGVLHSLHLALSEFLLLQIGCCFS